MDKIEKIARALAESHGEDPDILICPWLLPVTSKGNPIIGGAKQVPLWTDYAADAKVMIDVLGDR